jgi:hypothetical protein
MPDRYIRKQLKETFGARESSEVYLETDIDTGKSELIISKTFTERYPIQDYDKVMRLHKDLNRGGGRRAYKLKDLTK